MATVDILIPTYRRPVALAVTLCSVMAQTFQDYRVVVSDQTEDTSTLAVPTVRSAVAVLRARGRPVELHRHLPRRGMAEQRDFLLGRATAPYVLYLDDDVICEPALLERLVRAIGEQGCGFVGSALIGLSYLDDVRPHEHEVEFWEDRVTPEDVAPGTGWTRWRLHNAANPWHAAERFGADAQRQRYYKVDWVGGCVLYHTAALRDCGGFAFWRDLPPNHRGEDVVAQQRVLRRYGGCGMLPSGAYHQELPTTVVDRRVDATKVVPLTAPCATA